MDSNASLPNIADWVVAVSSAITAGSIIFLLYQAYLLRHQVLDARRQAKDDHERSRRELAITLIGTWSSGMLRESAAARKFVEALNAKQTRFLSRGEPFTVSGDVSHFLESCLGENMHGVVKKENGDLEMGVKAVTIVRWYLIRYLNDLECVMVAWRHQAADREIIGEQFLFLAENDELKQLRIEEGLDAYPAIREFIETYRPKIPRSDKRILGQETPNIR